jgi:hypothetical protein
MIEYQPADNGEEHLELTRTAQEGVDILERAARAGDPTHYQEIQALLLRDSDPGGDDHPDQTPGPLPEGLEVDG